MIILSLTVPNYHIIEKFGEFGFGEEKFGKLINPPKSNNYK